MHKAAKQLAHQARTLHHQARRAHAFLARLVTHPTTWWQRLLNRLYQRLATVFQHWADTRTAQALQHQQRATADTAQATTQAQQAIALQHQADALTLQAQAKQTQAQRLQTEARRQDQLARQAQTLAAHYRQLATQSGGTTLAQVTTVFAYDGQGHLIGGYDANGQSRREYIWLGDRPVALVQGGKTYALHTDQLGTPRAVTDPNGTVVWRWDGEPFGHTAPNTDPDGNGVSFTLNLRFPGQYADTETGLYYNWFRYYDPATGRYISSYPIGLRGGVNTYAYANLNPSKYSDKHGHSGSTATWDLFAGGAGESAAGTSSVIEAINPIAVVIAGMWPTTMGDSTLHSEECPAKSAAKKKEKACQALKKSILATCSSLTGRKKFACFSAAQKTYEQCMNEN